MAKLFSHQHLSSVVMSVFITLLFRRIGILDFVSIIVVSWIVLNLYEMLTNKPNEKEKCLNQMRRDIKNLKK